MKAILFKGKHISIIEKPIPSIGDEEALMKISMVGICNTDIELFNGYYDFEGVPGHEFVGIVEKAHQRTSLIGKRVVADINCGCGKCSHCISGGERHCPKRTVIGILGRDGAFAEYVKVPLRNIHIVDDIIGTQEAVFTEPLAAALEISQQIHIKNQSRIAVLGDGKLGLLAALGLRYYSSHIILCGKHKEKLQIAAAQGVKTFHIHSNTDYSTLMNQFGNLDIVVEATGYPDGINMAIGLARPEGIVIVKTTTHELSKINLATIAVKELQIIGSRCGDFDLALSFLKNGWIDVTPLIESTYPFSEFKNAFKHACKRGSKKVLVSFD